MNNLTQSIIGWCASLAIGVTICVSLNNIIIGIGLGAAFGALLGHIQMKKENSSSKEEENPTFVGFFVYTNSLIFYLIFYLLLTHLPIYLNILLA